MPGRLCISACVLGHAGASLSSANVLKNPLYDAWPGTAWPVPKGGHLSERGQS